MIELEIREITKRDITSGFLTSLDSLRSASKMDLERAAGILRDIKSNPNHTILVAVLDGQVIGSITLLIEPKFIHDGGLACHIEDVVVDHAMQGKGIGAMLVRSALEYAEAAGCYKTVLYCEDAVRPFYEKLGFDKKAHAMRFDH